MRIGHVRSCCNGQTGINCSLSTALYRDCFISFAFLFSIAFGVLGFEEPVKKKRLECP